jgi:hypothetical protein
VNVNEEQPVITTAPIINCPVTTLDATFESDGYLYQLRYNPTEGLSRATELYKKHHSDEGLQLDHVLIVLYRVIQGWVQVDFRDSQYVEDDDDSANVEVEREISDMDQPYMSYEQVQALDQMFHG